MTKLMTRMMRIFSPRDEVPPPVPWPAASVSRPPPARQHHSQSVSPGRWLAGQQYNLTARPPPPPPVTRWRWSPQPCWSALSRLAWPQPRRRRPPTWAASPSRTAASSASAGLSTPRSSWKDPDPKLVPVQATAISLQSTSSAINLRGKTISYINQRSGGRNIN